MVFGRIAALIYCFIVTCIFAGCQLPQPEHRLEATDSTATLFPLQPFMLRQMAQLVSQPYTMQRIEVLNGKSDTSVVAISDAAWGPVLKIFLAADINKASFLDQYRFSHFAEATTSTEQYFYEAKDPKLFTRLLTVATDKETKQIVSFYAETARGNSWSRTEQKLYYAPLRVVQVQEFTHSLIGPDKKSLLEYRVQRNLDESTEETL